MVSLKTKHTSLVQKIPYWNLQRVLVIVAVAVWISALFMPAYVGIDDPRVTLGYEAFGQGLFFSLLLIGFMGPYSWAWAANITFLLIAINILRKKIVIRRPGQSPYTIRLRMAQIGIIGVILSLLSFAVQSLMGDNENEFYHANPSFGVYGYVLSMVLVFAAAMISFTRTKNEAINGTR